MHLGRRAARWAVQLARRCERGGSSAAAAGAGGGVWRRWHCLARGGVCVCGREVERARAAAAAAPRGEATLTPERASRTYKRELGHSARPAAVHLREGERARRRTGTAWRARLMSMRGAAPSPAGAGHHADAGGGMARDAVLGLGRRVPWWSVLACARALTWAASAPHLPLATTEAAPAGLRLAGAAHARARPHPPPRTCCLVRPRRPGTPWWPVRCVRPHLVQAVLPGRQEEEEAALA